MRTNISLPLLTLFFSAVLSASCAATKTAPPDGNGTGATAAAAAAPDTSDDFAKAAALADRRHYDDAVKIYKDLISRKEKVQESYENLARLYLDQQEFIFSAHLNGDQPTMEYDNALEMCAGALKIDPSSAKALAVRGEIRFDQGDFKGAAEDLKRADEIDKSVRVKYLLSAAYGNLGNKEEADKYQKAAKAEDTGDRLSRVHK